MSRNTHSANLALIFVILITLGCSCSKLAELSKKHKTEPSSNRPVTTATTEQETDEAATGKYELTLAQFEQLKIGMARSEVEAILGGKGEEISSSEGGGMKFSVNKWEGPNFKSVILSFKNDKIMTKNQVGLK